MTAFAGAAALPDATAARQEVAFPRRYRLTQTDEYSSVFGFRRALRGNFFLLHYGEARPGSARLGLVIGKKCLKRAVGRNAVKRVLREAFRLLRASLPERDLIFRLSIRLEKPGRRLRQEIAAEAHALLERLARRLARENASGREVT
ncbi:MAG: ribonuclease P protein component [Zoogloeaceae bacterium]|jgi:ribonuclease P protein component|nr:ribonuclease P protein component [Zoogloeaceae bacterium]